MNLRDRAPIERWIVRGDPWEGCRMARLGRLVGPCVIVALLAAGCSSPETPAPGDAPDGGDDVIAIIDGSPPPDAMVATDAPDDADRGETVVADVADVVDAATRLDVIDATTD